MPVETRNYGDDEPQFSQTHVERSYRRPLTRTEQLAVEAKEKRRQRSIKNGKLRV